MVSIVHTPIRIANNQLAKGRHRMREPNTPEIDVEEFAAARESGTLEDVRELDEHLAGHVPNAVLIPMGQLANRLGEIDKTSPVFVICASETGAVP